MTRRWLARLALLVPWLGTWLLYREHKRAVARMERLLRDINDISFKRMEVRDSEILMELSRDSLAARIWAGIWQETIDAIGAPNFLEFKFGRAADADSWLVVTVQRVPGLTPADKLRDAEARLRALEAEAYAGHVRADIEREWNFPCSRCGTPTTTRRKLPAGHVETRCNAHLDGTAPYPSDDQKNLQHCYMGHERTSAHLCPWNDRTCTCCEKCEQRRARCHSFDLANPY